MNSQPDTGNVINLVHSSQHWTYWNRFTITGTEWILWATLTWTVTKQISEFIL